MNKIKVKMIEFDGYEPGSYSFANELYRALNKAAKWARKNSDKYVIHNIVVNTENAFVSVYYIKDDDGY